MPARLPTASPWPSLLAPTPCWHHQTESCVRVASQHMRDARDTHRNTCIHCSSHQHALAAPCVHAVIITQPPRTAGTRPASTTPSSAATRTWRRSAVSPGSLATTRRAAFARPSAAATRCCPTSTRSSGARQGAPARAGASLLHMLRMLLPHTCTPSARAADKSLRLQTSHDACIDNSTCTPLSLLAASPEKKRTGTPT